MNASDNGRTAAGDRLELVAATANPHKLTEIEQIMGDGWRILPRPVEVGDIVEDADTLEGNARLKARTICEATGLPAVADDTGLEVDALGGAPGVHSARYAGIDGDSAANVAKLLDALADVDDAARTARFRTVAMVAWPDGSETVATGVVEGHIARVAHGAGGFGYDPVFVPVDADGRTFAEMADAEKNAISHRGRAFRALAVGVQLR
ncbi:MAG: RdgB/HAM1 family non-canonical purine NTP pyrophosphatase [Acidimicrobiales bacterium]